MKREIINKWLTRRYGESYDTATDEQREWAEIYYEGL